MYYIVNFVNSQHDTKNINIAIINNQIIYSDDEKSDKIFAIKSLLVKSVYKCSW